MIIHITNLAIITDLTRSQTEHIKRYLTISNPKLIELTRLGLNAHKITKYLTCYKHHGDRLLVPIGALPYITSTFSYSMSKADIIDNRVTHTSEAYFSKLKPHKGFKLRDYQEEIVSACMEKSVGVVEAMTGSGKTIAFAELILRRRQNTLVLVHTTELANQPRAAIAEYLNVSEDAIGFIGGGTFKVKPITVGLLQSLASFIKTDDGFSKIDLINEKFGQIICDETHIIAADSYYNVMTELKAKYKFGFSATPKREDGLTNVIFFATGPRIHVVDKDRLKKVLMKPDLREIQTDYYFPLMQTSEYQDMVSDLSLDEERNNLILETLKDYKDKPICILCSRLSQVEYLQDKIKDSVILTSKMTKKNRKQVMEDLLLKKKNIVISTYGLFSTGINIPHLEIVFLAGPMQSEIKIKQTAGRLMRKAKGKNSAIMVDFDDKKVDLLHRQFLKRRRILRKL